jgi:hypothetical protein
LQCLGRAGQLHALTTLESSALAIVICSTFDNLGPSWALNGQPFMNMAVSPHERPLPRFGNDRIPNQNGKQEILLRIIRLAYAAFHLAGWNFTFPTKIELILWRT